MTYIVIATRGHEMDAEYLKHALGIKAAYIGMMGAPGRGAETYKELNEIGLYPDRDERIHELVGPDLGGKKPSDIALAIMAKIQKRHTNATGDHLKLKEIMMSSAIRMERE